MKKVFIVNLKHGAPVISIESTSVGVFMWGRSARDYVVVFSYEGHNHHIEFPEELEVTKIQESVNTQIENIVGEHK